MTFPAKEMLELCMEAFDRLGGSGGLKQHYSMIEALCRERGVQCPSEEHVRVIIYHYTPGRKNHLRRGNLFAIVGRGEYRVTRQEREGLS